MTLLACQYVGFWETNSDNELLLQLLCRVELRMPMAWSWTMPKTDPATKPKQRNVTDEQTYTKTREDT